MKKKILIIDDEPDLPALVAARLKKAGYDVSLVYDYESAFEHIEKSIPDLILLDVMMPGKSGYEVCNELKSREDTRNVPVILFTAKEGQVSRLKSNAGFVEADGYILKPFKPEVLLSKIKELMG